MSATPPPYEIPVCESSYQRSAEEMDHRPILPIVIHGARSTAVSALIDSGADRSVFHVSIADEIGIPLEAGEKEIFSGIEGGALPARLHRVKIEIMGMEGSTELIAGFVDADGVSAILGQDGFFDQYRIKFEKDHDTFEITPASKR